MAALAAFEAAQKLDPKLEGLDRQLASANIQLARFSEAARYAEAYVRAQPQDPAGYEILGMAYTGLRQYEKAQAVLQKALEINPTFEQAKFRLGQMYGVKGDPQAALGVFEEILQDHPSSGPAQTGSCRPCFRKGSTTRSSSVPRRS